MASSTSRVRHAMVLTAGLGTRLHPLTAVRAKPAVPVAGAPLIRGILGSLAAAGVTDVVVNLHHLPHTLTAVIGDGSDFDLRVRYTWEHPVILGSAGGPRLALPLLGDDVFFLVNGDTLSDVNFAALAEAHFASGALVTLALSPVHDPSRYGGVRLDDNGTVVEWVPRGRTVPGTRHFFGVQIAHREAFASLPPGVPAETIGSLYSDWMAERPGSIRGMLVDAAFWDIGTVADYWRTNQALLDPHRTRDGAMGARVRIHPSARVTDSILWDDVEIDAGSRIDHCIVTDGVRVPPGMQLSWSVLNAGDDSTPAVTPFTVP